MLVDPKKWIAGYAGVACVLDRLGEIVLCTEHFRRKFRTDPVGQRLEVFLKGCDPAGLLKAELRGYQGFAQLIHVNCSGDFVAQQVEISPFIDARTRHVEGLVVVLK